MKRLQHSGKNRPLRLVRAEIAVTIALLCSAATVAAAEPHQTDAAMNDTLAAMAEIYDITAEEAVTRLARETDAAIQAGLVSSMDIPSYAGAWYDDFIGKLVVAVADTADAERIATLDVVHVLVDRSLEELERDRAALIGDLNRSDLSDFIVSHYVDYQRNSVVIEVLEGAEQDVSDALADRPGDNRLDIRAKSSVPKLSSTPVRAAMKFGNLDQPLIGGSTFPCSVGAAVNGGFVTAGHCGAETNNIVSGSGAQLGDTAGSTWPFPGPTTPFQTIDSDVGHVTTVSGWAPSATIQGYTDGVFSVSPSWGGLTQFPLNSTVCRYGGTSGGPHCGQIDAINVEVKFDPFAPRPPSIINPDQGKVAVRGLTRVRNTCSEDGDSGGPYVAGVGVIQGTNVGIELAGAICPSDHNGWFQPIADNLDEWAVTMLTSHGASAPSVVQVACPDLDNSGLGTYQCEISDVSAQGAVTQSWSANTGGSTTSRVFIGSCSGGQTVTATLQLFNQYGTTTKNYSFGCPMDPIP